MSTEAVDSLPPDAFSDALWSELLPWLAQYSAGTLTELSNLSPAADWWLTESPAVSSTVIAMSQIRRAIAQLAVSDMPTVRLGQLVPDLPSRTSVAALRPSSRSMTALQRLPANDVAELNEFTITDLFDIRGTGIGTVVEIVEALVTLAVLRRPDVSAGAPATAPPEGEQRRPAEQQLLDDLRQLARWRQVRGDLAQPLLGPITVGNHVPEEIQDLALRLAAITGSDLVPSDMLPDPFEELSALSNKLDDRELTVVRERFVAPQPRTLAQLGEQFGVSRERVRQIEAAVRSRMTAAFVFGTGVGSLLASMRVEIQPVCALDRLIARHPELARNVPELGVPLWLVLDRLDDYFEVTDGWAAAPDVERAREQTRTLLEDFETPDGVAPLDAVENRTHMPKDELRAWLVWCGYQILDGKVLIRTTTAADHAAALLAVAGEPLKLDEILARMTPTRSSGTVSNVLGADERFVRTDRTTWALASWDLDAYTSIRDQVGRALDAAGGEITLDDLVRDLTARFQIAPSSVNTYASAGEFEVVQGVVRRRTAPEMPQKGPADTRRLFRHRKHWRYRLTVNRDHLRGSGFTVPSGVAVLVGCTPGVSVELVSRLGTQSIRWNGPQAASGTIRRFLEDIQAVENDVVYLEFWSDARFDVTPASDADRPEDPIRRALALVGGPSFVDPDDSMAVIAWAVGLDPEAPPRRVISTCRRRGDDDVAEQLEKAWLQHEPFEPPPTEQHDADATEFQPVQDEPLDDTT